MRTSTDTFSNFFLAALPFRNFVNSATNSPTTPSMTMIAPTPSAISQKESHDGENIKGITTALECFASPKTVSRRRRCRCQNGKCSRRGRRRLSLSYSLKFLGGRERQAAFAVEQLFQPPVAGTRFAPDDFRRNTIAQFAAVPPPFQPVCVAD